MFSRAGRRKEEETMWPGYGPPPPMYYPMGYQMPPVNGSKDDYVKYLRKQLKAAEAKKEGGKKEEKKIWWKRMEVTATLFFFSPIIVAVWIGMLELSLLGIRTLIH